MVTARENLLLLLLPVAGALLIAFALLPYGPALDRAGLHSMSAASSLLSGEVVRMSRGEAFTLWPPLLPFLLASAKSFGLPYLWAAAGLNVVSCFVLPASVGS